MGMLAKSLKHSIWYASKILHGTRYAEQNKEVRGTPWGEGGIASRLPGVHLKKLYFTEIWEKHFIGGIAFHKNKSLVS